MVIKIKCSKVVGQAVMQLFATIEAIVPNYKPEDLLFELDPSDPVERRIAARTHYVAKLPMKNGKFDMAGVEETVRKNLESLGKNTIIGVIYQDIVDGTLAGAQMIEKEIRERHSYKAGTSQREIGNLCRGGLVDALPIIHKAAEDKQ